jgi:hypothetical protein
VNQTANTNTPFDFASHGLPELSLEEFAALISNLAQQHAEALRLCEILNLGATDPKAARRRLHSEPLPPKMLMPLFYAAAICLAHEAFEGDPAPVEARVQDGFFANLDTYLPGAVRAIVKHVPGFVPDGFVSLDGAILPVEVKRKRFTALGRRQLLSYMEAHGSPRGIAVAPVLACDLPDSITFVAVAAGEVL